MPADSNGSFFVEQFSRVALGAVLFGIVFAAYCFRKWRMTPAADWPVIEGRVQSARVIVGEGRDRGKHAVISYSYFVNEYQSGEYTRTFLREQAADDFARGLKDSKVQVHYNPRNPAVSNLKGAELDHLLLSLGKTSLG